MNNRKLIILAVTVIVIITMLIVGAFLIRYAASFKKVSIEIERHGITAEVYKHDSIAAESDDAARIATLQESGDISLRPGTYFVRPVGENIDGNDISFTVGNEDMSVTINPGYSAEYLDSQLAIEFPDIKKVLESKYSTVLSRFTLQRGQLYLDANWYGTILTEKSPRGDTGDTYRTVLRKVNDKWEIAAIPQLVLSAPEHPNIPKEILSDLNQVVVTE